MQHGDSLLENSWSSAFLITQLLAELPAVVILFTEIVYGFMGRPLNLLHSFFEYHVRNFVIFFSVIYRSSAYVRNLSHMASFEVYLIYLYCLTAISKCAAMEVW